MANTIVEFFAPSGQLLILSLYLQSVPDVIVNDAGGDACMERTNAKGWYTATVTQAVVGRCNAVVKNAANTVLGGFVIDMIDDAATHRELLTELPTSSQIAAQILVTPAQKIATDEFGNVSVANAGTAEDVWASPVRTLTMTAAQVAGLARGDFVRLRAGSTTRVTFTGLALEGVDHVAFTMKRHSDVLLPGDDAAIVKVDSIAGLVRVNKETALDPGHGSLVLDEISGTADLELRHEASVLLTAIDNLRWDLEAWMSNGDKVGMLEGLGEVYYPVTRV